MDKLNENRPMKYIKTPNHIQHMEHIQTPLTSKIIKKLKIGHKIMLSGSILTGRDAALPRLVKLAHENKSPITLEGAAIMHTAVSPAGIAPTSSNKTEIESSIGPLSQAGVKMHIGKGALSGKTIELLKENNSLFVVTPPAAALLTSKMLSSEVVAFPEEGMEALHRIEVKDFPGIVAVAHGESIY